MDPNATLKELRALVKKVQADPPSDYGNELHDYERVVELFDGLDEWLTMRGFPPDAWRG